MSRRLWQRVGRVRIYRDTDYNEYEVLDERQREGEGYFTSDKQDAVDTANAILRRENPSGGAKMPQAFYYADAKELLRGKSSRNLGANTELIEYDNGVIVVKLYATDIIAYDPDGLITLNNGGHATNLTMGRINAFLSPRIQVFKQKGTMYAQTRTGKVFPFRGNIVHIGPNDLERTHSNPSHIDDAGHVHLSDDDYGVFTWREDGKYIMADSVFNSRSEKRAQAKADKLNDEHPELGRFGYVVRQLKYLRRF